ncbi:MAG: PH domain-containing protein [Planctomycetes bacterium]|nr:PH domain-containing protein [Planctomycetota bacterium]
MSEGVSEKDPDEQRSVDSNATPSDRSPSNADDPPPITDGPQRLDPRWITVERISSWIYAGIVTIALLIFLGLCWSLGWFGLWLRLGFTLMSVGVSASLVYRAHIYPTLWYRRASYVLSQTTIEIRTGVWWRSVTSVPRSRIQHTDVEQGPLMRKYGIAKLIIHTAGTQHATVELIGLSRQQADRTRDHLIARVAGAHESGRADGV